MPSIYLKETQGPYDTGSVTVNVTPEAYPHSNLFTRYKHEFTGDKNGAIKIYKSMSDFRGLTLKPDGEYVKKQLSHAYVYFNRFDTGHKHPLLLSLHFKGDIPEGKGFYLQYTEIKSYYRYRRPLEISYMSDFKNDKELFSILINENYYTNNSITYYINKTNNKGNDSNYNFVTISISQKEQIPNGQSNGFYKYTHKPKYGDMKSYILYNKHVLARNDKNPIDEIQGQIYSSITVYFGTRAKSSGRGRNQKDIPLLIELTKTSPPSDPDYYVHKRKPDGQREYYWEQLPGDSAGTTLKELLVDMGFGMDRGENGYDQLKKLLTEASVNGVDDGDGDLSTKLEEVKGDKLKRLLSQKVGQGGDSASQKSFLQLLLQKIEFDLLDSVVILLEKNTATMYNDSQVGSAVTSKLQPPRTINRVSMAGGKNITVTDVTGDKGQCVKDYGYKLISHDISKVVENFGGPGQSQLAIRFIIPSETNGNYHQLKLYDKDKPDPENLQYTYYSTGQNEVYVYFYGDDPRPLLVCYNGCAYKPRNLDNTDKNKPVQVTYSEWEKVATISTCTCQNGDTTSPPNTHILKALNDVTGFLNPVQINPNQIPNSASGKITGESGESPSTKKATYELHTYLPGTTIKMGITREDVGCYDKYTYQPYGTKGSYDPNFRLGNVIHTNTSRGTQHSPLDYTNLGPGTNKYYPVVGVTVYYYDSDKQYDNPLLIELEFKTNGGDGTDKEYYMLTQAGGDSSGNLTWAKDEQAQGAVSSVGGGAGNEKIVAYLDKIRHSLKPVVKIYIDKTGQYPLCVSTNPGGRGDTYSPNGGGKQIQVTECSDDGGCSKLSERGYKCYQHKVSQINSGGFDYNTIGGLKFFISGKNSASGGSNGDKDIEIKLHTNGDSGDTQIKELTYNTCMGDVYVFFYCKPNCPVPESKPPSAPLMLYYNENYYKPESIDHYFKKWVPETGLAGTSSEKPCGSDPGSTQLATKLNDVNRALNRINLGPSTVSGISTSATSQYGISKPTGEPQQKTPNIELNRIQVTKLDPKPERPYCKLVHRTMNSFDIGDIWYGDQDITKGVQINGGSISVDSNGGGTKNHTQFVLYNNPNTVVAYYHAEDKTHKLPQLIVLLQTEQAIDAGTDPITAKATTQYGYYVLATGTGANTFKYEWRQPKDPQPDPFKLDDQTEFKLLNSIVILVNQQQKYQEGVIQGALTNSKAIRSPGNENGVNRLKDRDITVKDATETSGKCVSKYGYVLKSHDLTTVTAKIHNIDLILGLRFLIPGKSSATEYKQISLYKQDTTEPQNIEYIYFDGTNKTLYVYFYGEDPRPLLLCYSKSAYIPKKLKDPTQLKQVDVDYLKWTKVDGITKCVCDNGGTDNSNKILDTLLNVVLFLNPVQLNPKQIPTGARTQIIPTEPPPKTTKEATYNLHQYKASSYVKMKITRDDVKCYEKYTYEPAGTSNDGTGFRLGNVIYHETGTDTFKGNINYPNDIAFLYDPLVKVTVYYYDHDTLYSDPLLIELEFKKIIGPGTPINLKEYYKLTKNDGTSNVDWKLDPDAQTHIGKGDTDNKNLINYLDKIRYGFKKLVRIEIQHNSDKNYELRGRPANGSPGSGFTQILFHKKIQVEQCSDSGCQKLKTNNYTCFKHTLAGLQSTDHHQIGGVVMTLPSKNGDNQAVEIPIFDSNDQQKQLYYNSCMNDLIVHVYFYFITRTSQVDSVPLMLCYNSNYYKPIDRDDYLHLWHHEESLNSAEPCKKDDMIKTHLDLINKELNRIDLTHKITSGSTSQYGIPTDKPPPKNPAISLNRIQLTTIPGKPIANRPYCKLVHRTINDFRIGEIWYGDKEIEYNVKLNGTGTPSGPTIINVDKNGDGKKNHREFAKTNKPNTVVVYYSTGDSDYKLPQLILLMTTEKPIEPSTDPITATTGTSYGYYIINHSDGVCSDLKYEWREPQEKQPPDPPLKLDEQTELSLLNSVVILVEQKPNSAGSTTNDKYGDEKINNAVQKAIDLGSLTKSPGLPNDINRLKGKDVTPTDETTQAQGLDQTGFRSIKHDLSKIVDPNIPGATGVTLIAILRFLIPTPEGGGQYTVLNLYESVQRKENTIFFHQKDQNNVCVYFYNQDPRPLLLCYNKIAYRAFSIPSYDNQRWYKAPKVSDCACNSTNSKSLLLALIKISNTLNPVEIQKTTGPSYNIHKFNGQQISIKITETPGSEGFCYNKYVHTHNGTGSGGTGFRLGIINYNSLCIQDSTKSLCISSLISHKGKYDPASEVVVYYYKGDPSHNNPLLVVFCAGETTCTNSTQYYLLEKYPKSDHKKYKKQSNNINLDPTKGGQLEKILDSLLYKGNKILQINLGFKIKTTIVQYPGKSGKQTITINKKTYLTRVYENQVGKQVKTNENIEVQVSGPTDISDATGKKTGYMCYQHKLTSIEDISQINGLRLFLWDNRGSGDDDDSQCKPTPSNPITKHKCCELDLYENGTQPSGTCSTNKIEQIAYTTCKGDLYVYFYASGKY